MVQDVLTADDPSRGLSAEAVSEELVELWKRSECIKFRDHLERLEMEKSAQFAAELGRVKKIERKLKLKLVELENKERELCGKEIELKRAREETALKLKRQAEEHASAIKLIHQQHAAAIAAAARPDSARTTRAAVTGPKIKEGNKQRELEVELRMKQFELDQALEREALLAKSRDHFRAAVLRFTRDRMAGPDRGTIGSVNSAGSIGSEVSSVVTRLQQRRAELLASGLYGEMDDTVQQLDEKIHRALAYTA